jgi:hypothetical protein
MLDNKIRNQISHSYNDGGCGYRPQDNSGGVASQRRRRFFILDLLYTAV